MRARAATGAGSGLGPGTVLGLGLVLGLVLGLAGCGGDDTASKPWDRACPGPGCAASDGSLEVGAAAETITPVLVESEWQDLDGNHHWSQNEPFTDVNGNGKFDAVWLAGHNEGRPARVIRNDTWVRAIAIRDGDTTVVFVTIDALGYFKQEMDLIRAALPASLGVDLLVVSSTHDHSTQDVIGIWGQDDATTGLDPAYMARIRSQAVKAVTRAVDALAPATLTVGQLRVEEPAGDVRKWIHDSRDPVVIDPFMTVLRFSRAGQPASAASTIATWVLFSAHPDFAGSRDNELTSDFPHMLRTGVEAQLGGMCLYSNGEMGAQIGGGNPQTDVVMRRPDGTITTGAERADLYGAAIVQFAVRAQGPGSGAETLASAPLRFRTRVIRADVDNYRYQTAALLHLFDRKLMDYDPALPLSRPAGNVPRVESEVSLIELGPIAIATFPGELSPELYLGGYDGAWSGGNQLVDTTRPFPPDISKAPPGPYLRDLLLARPGVRYAVGLGCAQDFLGYIMPTFDFVIDADDPWFDEAPGEHYEETAGVGSLADAQLIGPLRLMIATP